MTEFVVDEAGLLKAGQALTALQAENLIRPNLETFGRSVVDVVQQYPSQTSPHYRRTGNLRQRWERSLAPPLGERVRNPAPYSGFVMGEKQPYAWRYGWPRLKKVMMDKMDIWILEMESKAWRLWERT